MIFFIFSGRAVRTSYPAGRYCYYSSIGLEVIIYSHHPQKNSTFLPTRGREMSWNLETWTRKSDHYGEIGCNAGHFLKSAQVFSVSCLFPPMPPLPRRGSKFEKNHQKYGEKSGFSWRDAGENSKISRRTPLLPDDGPGARQRGLWFFLPNMSGIWNQRIRDSTSTAKFIMQIRSESFDYPIILQLFKRTRCLSIRKM